MSKNLDELMQTAALQPPEDFVRRVMQQIDLLPQPTAEPRPRDWLQWLALIGGIILGAAQLASFMFGVWATTTAG